MFRVLGSTLALRRLVAAPSVRAASTSAAPPRSRTRWVGAAALLIGGGFWASLQAAASAASPPAPKIEKKPPTTSVTPPAETKAEIFAGARKEGLPLFTYKDVEQHNTPARRVWVTFREGVYDVTDFIELHPGGSKILLAAGGSLEPFWDMYEQHKELNPQEILETHRIGNLDTSSPRSAPKTDGRHDSFELEPERHPALHVISKRPFNAETPSDVLDSFITPNELFFVRNHLAVPLINAESYVLEVVVEGVEKTTLLTLEDLRTKFPQHTLAASIQCGGNRRSEMIATRWVQGIAWSIGAISNATWTGPLLRDVLKYAGYDDSNENLQHVQFEGLDCDAVCCYGASIPIEKAASRSGDVILALEMNGHTLPRDHGYPVRVVVPGTVGSRSVKWLGRVVVSHQESQSFWQQRDYKLFSPSANYPTVDFATAPSMQEMPVQSAIYEPADGSVLPPSIEVLTVKGYAWSGGGRHIARVDVSLDGGKFWHTAEIKPSPEPFKQQQGRAWAWALWEAKVPVPPEMRNQVEVVCKAVDSNYSSQPESIDPIWNLRGLNNNAWHRIQVWLPRGKTVAAPPPAAAPPTISAASYYKDKKPPQPSN